MDVDIINHGKTSLVRYQSQLLVLKILSASSVARRASCSTDHKRLKACASRISSTKTTVPMPFARIRKPNEKAQTIETELAVANCSILSALHERNSMFCMKEIQCFA